MRQDKTERISFAVTQKEKEHIYGLAEKMGMTVSEFIRYCLEIATKAMDKVRGNK